MVDAGLDLGKTEPQSLELLRASDRLAALGYPRVPVGLEQAVPLASCSTSRSPTPPTAPWPRTPSASRSGCRVLRAHDVRAARRVADVMAAVLAAGMRRA